MGLSKYDILPPHKVNLVYEPLHIFYGVRAKLSIAKVFRYFVKLLQDQWLRYTHHRDALCNDQRDDRYSKGCCRDQKTGDFTKFHSDRLCLFAEGPSTIKFS